MERGGSSGGGCCIARYTNHGPNNNTTYPYYTYHNSNMDRIMLRFRPIAPKPAAGGSNPPALTAAKGLAKTIAKKKRKVRNTTTSTKGVVRRKSRSPDDQTLDGSSNGEESSQVVTLPLLPETPDLSPKKNNSQDKKVGPMWLCFGSSDQDQTATEVVGSSVIVEGVTDTWVDGNGLGRTDEERKRRLDEDTCPGFISDGWNRVWWTNKAYQSMVTGVADSWSRKDKVVVVKVGMREKVELPPVKLYPAFTCRVRVRYGNHSMTVPCDAWRMNCGGFAWRLDVKAALSLSL